MVSELCKIINECVAEVAITKVISVHSKLWISRDIADLLKCVRKQKKKCRLRKSRVNVQEHKNIQAEVIYKIKVAENEWWLAECEKLKQASDSEKWRIINRLTNQTTSVGIQPLKKLIDG